MWASFAYATPAAAAQTSDDCRCVDADGNAIADCTCFRAPRFEAMTMLGFDRPRLGISVSSEQGGELDAQGARVTGVLEDGPAWDAGIREGDVITAIDGQSLFDALPGDREDDFDLDRSVPVQRLLAIARELEPGAQVGVTYLRDGDEHTTTVTAEDLSKPGMWYAPFDTELLRDRVRELNPPNLRVRPDVPAVPGVRVVPGTPGSMLWDYSRFSRYGLELIEMNAGLGQYFGTTQGVLVVDVAEGSELRLEAGDVILRIGDREALTPDRVIRILGSYGADEDITIHIRRDGREMSVLGRLGG
jgi:S1-C subfamily serine protease